MIELATPGSAVRLAFVARHVNECATRPGKPPEPFCGEMCLPHISELVVFSGLESTGMLCRYERAAMALARMRVCTGLSEFSLLAFSISIKLNSHVLMCTNKSLHINVVHFPASETSFKWRVAGGPNDV